MSNKEEEEVVEAVLVNSNTYSIKETCEANKRDQASFVIFILLTDTEYKTSKRKGLLFTEVNLRLVL